MEINVISLFFDNQCQRKGSGMAAKLFIIIPCYNEEQVLPVTSALFLDEIELLVQEGKAAADSRICFVNDGSSDKTWEMIQALARENRYFMGISLSRNRGHQNALLAGLMEAVEACDVTISIDCDGQDDIGAMGEMMDAFYAGYDVVYGVRSARNTDTWFKRFSAHVFYKLLKVMGIEVVYDHADYRLISSKVLKELEKFHEVNLFLRGMVPLVGFQSTAVYYERKERLAGRSHYPLSKMLGLAFDGITSLSIRPIRVITVLGLTVSVISFFGVLWAFFTALSGKAVIGWASMLCMVGFVGGVQLMALGVIGEYIGKIYLETKARPRYIISEKTEESVEAYHLRSSKGKER